MRAPAPTPLLSPQLVAAWPRQLRAGSLRCTRVEDPAVTRARLEPALSTFGITRVANVTGLDRLGLPVTMVVRPNARSIAVSQGKGPTLDAAWVSGVMESIELSCAETPRVNLRLASARALGAHDRVVDVERLPLRQGSPFHPDLPMLWAEGVEALSGDRIYVPYEVIHLDSTPPLPPGEGCFESTSNGLASGSVPQEAFVHAVCELVERDALRRWGDRWAGGRLVDLSSVRDPGLADLLLRCRLTQFDVLAWDLTSHVALPALACLLVDCTEPSDTLRGAAMGFGCHLRRETALQRALTEAAQSRLTLIAGSRDDLGRADYHGLRRHAEGIEAYRRLVARPPDVRLDALPTHLETDLYGQVELLLRLLVDAGAAEVGVVDLSPAGASVLRVVVPGLLGPGHVH